jgi:hypothetical protein
LNHSTLIAVCLFSSAASAAEPLFQNHFFTLSQSSELLCATSEQQFLPRQTLIDAVYFYEREHPGLRAKAVAVLTDHQDPDFLDEIKEYREDCAKAVSTDLCVLEKYWDDDKEAALRTLALFYDTKTVIKHSDEVVKRPEDEYVRRFNVDHIRLFEKAVRKIPAFLRQAISKAKPADHLKQAIADKPNAIQELILDAFPEDYLNNVWEDHTHPLTLVPGIGFRAQTIAQVFSGQNMIVFTVKPFDKGKEGGVYRDIELQYLVDFRLPIVVHEIAHTIDNFHFWNGSDDLYFFYKYRKLSNDEQIAKIIADAQLALWPSKWFEAFEYLPEVNQGRYDGNTQEKLAELLAQYILIPERLQRSAPTAYRWLRDEVFRGIEYQGYDRCPTPLTRPLHWWQHATGKALGH